MSRPAAGEVDPDEAVRGLFLIVPRASAASSEQVARVLETGTVVGVLLEEEAGASGTIRAACRSAGVAAFALSLEAAIEGHADGVLLDQPSAVEGARTALGDDRLIGAQARVSRHAAMVAGEAGADFVAFGDQNHAVSDRLVETVAWWTDLFVLPALALADDCDEAGARRLAQAGADFLGVRLDWLDQDPAVARRLARAFGATGTR